MLEDSKKGGGFRVEGFRASSVLVTVMIFCGGVVVWGVVEVTVLGAAVLDIPSTKS